MPWALDKQHSMIVKKNCEDFEAAIKKGEARGIVHVTNKLREQINEGNTTATIFFLKAKAGWKET